ncbi:MAG: bifunctional glutamate N-acetyltransferase/amino-acid acetyltransferase ArgJ [Spirochaetia bacterium]|nr:bifunctional glutamate N-acetyltransferase/amino-acid acetyltransferase ArgJ [Spirochaetia bacterium]
MPKGYSSLAINCGIKDKSLDLGIIHSEKPANAAAFFTTNKIKGAPVLVGKKHINDGLIQTLIVNSKVSNVAMGKKGYEDALYVCKKTAENLNIKTDLIFPSSTGVIGRPLPVDKIVNAITNLKTKLIHPPDFKTFAEAIMTTDTFPKYVSKKIGSSSLIAVAKGAGMIEPNMATMLTYFFTDAEIEAEALRKIFHKAVDNSFNCLSVDSDTSTSDTALILANGLAGRVDLSLFEEKVFEAAIELTKMLAFDAEGATKLFIVDIEGAKDNEQAKKIGKSIINSPLVKTAIYQGDPNWGRIYMAIGKTPDVEIDEEKIELFWGKTPKKYSNDELKSLSEYIKSSREIYLKINLNIKDGISRVYGCDLTEEYVRINAFYTT